MQYSTPFQNDYHSYNNYITCVFYAADNHYHNNDSKDMREIFSRTPKDLLSPVSRVFFLFVCLLACLFPGISATLNAIVNMFKWRIQCKEKS